MGIDLYLSLCEKTWILVKWAFCYKFVMVQLDDQSTIVQKEISLIFHPRLFFNNRQFIHTKPC
jgi:hypothetical protein